VARPGRSASRGRHREAGLPSGHRGRHPPQDPVWASEAIDLITDLRSAAELVGALSAEAEATLARIIS